MSETSAPQKLPETPQKAAAGRVFKISLDGIPPVDAAMWEQIRAAARKPRPERRYPEITEVPDGSI
jgi:hypothetical protein